MNINEKRPGASRELRGAENEKSVCKIWLAFSRRQVNEIRIGGLLFGRGLLLAGLAYLGWPWSCRLSLWLAMLDTMRETLRVVEVAK